jgi:hypothetical protein
MLVIVHEQKRPPRRDAGAFDVLPQLLGEPILRGKSYDESSLDDHTA